MYFLTFEALHRINIDAFFNLNIHIILICIDLKDILSLHVRNDNLEIAENCKTVVL